MSRFDQRKYTELLNELDRQLKVIANYRTRKPPIKKKPEKYVNDVLNSYNEVRQYLSSTKHSLTEASASSIHAWIEEYNSKILSHIAIFKYTAEILNDLSEINLDTVQQISDEDANKLSESIVGTVDNLDDDIEEDQVAESTSNTKAKSTNSVDINIELSGKSTVANSSSLDSEPASITFVTTENTQTDKMPQSKEDVIKLCAPTLNYKFSGEYTKLASFVNDITMLNEVVEDTNKDFFLKILKARLEGKAIEAINDNVRDFDSFVKEVEAVSQPDSSEVVEGKLLALRIDKMSVAKFTKQCEELTQALRNSYISEKHTKEKATELTIKKTVEVCRRQARTEAVRSVLGAATFTSPSAVVSRLVTEQNTVNKERREMNSRNSGASGSNFYKKQGNGKNFGKNFNRNGNKYGDNGNGHGKPHGHNSGGRNNYNNYNNKGQYNFKSDRGYKRSDNVVRFFQGNEQRPSQDRRAAPTMSLEDQN